MKNYNYFWLFYAIFNCSTSLAASDPVSWQVSPATGFATTPVGNQSNVVYTLTNHLPGNVVMTTALTINGPGITVSDQCNGVTLAREASCTVSLQFIPTISSTTTAQLTYGYHNNRIPLPTLTALATGGTNTACTTVSITPLLPFPTNTYKYADNVVQFQVTNNCPIGQAPLNLGQFTISPTTGTATVAPIPQGSGFDQCSNQVLASGQSCKVTASVIPTSINNLTITAGITPVGGTSATTTLSTTVASNQQPTHHILFVNQCNFDVWYGIANGTGQNCPGPGCLSPDPNLIANPGGAPASSYHLPAQIPGQAPSTIDLATASYQNGAFWPRTGCTVNSTGNFTCTTGGCATITNTATCNSTGPLVQPQSPYTKFEATLQTVAGTDGVYDVSAINGMNVPVEVKAFGPPTGNTASTVYNCSGAGAIMQPATNDNLGNCSWNYNASSAIAGATTNNDFYWVTPGSNDGCTNSIPPNLCGMAWGSGPLSDGEFGTPINRRNGAFLGINTLGVYAAYTSPGQWGTSVNLFTKYGLDIEIPGQDSTTSYGTIPNGVYFNGQSYLSYYILIGCPAVSSSNALNSCYQTPTNNDFSHCCGCIDWTNTLPSDACGYASMGQYATGMNIDWTGSTGVTIPKTDGESYTPQQAISWIKDACPTAYSYTYDDPSSSFTCTQDENVDLYTSYQVTFCPGGVSGLPEGAAEGRNVAP